MKFDPLFQAENNKLKKIADGTFYSTENLYSLNLDQVTDVNAGISEDKKIITAVTVPFGKVDFGEGNYNEEALAALRDYLKQLEEKEQYAFIIPTSEKEISDSDTADYYIKAMVHTARRIKDCVSVIGFAIPKEFLEKDSEFDETSYTSWFINEMSVKHGHYLYFVSKEVLNACGLLEKAEKTSFIIY